MSQPLQLLAQVFMKDRIIKFKVLQTVMFLPQLSSDEVWKQSGNKGAMFPRVKHAVLITRKFVSCDFQ